jgi:acyl-ACP thioesterase
MSGGRVVEVTRTIGLGDVRPDTTARLDALARIVQDVADADAASAPIEGMGVWILRRLAMRIARTPRFRAEVNARTWCSGAGPRWAERRTQLHVADVLCVEATALWVHTDPTTGTPTPLPDAFHDVWGRDVPRVSSRLQHDKPPFDAVRTPWPLRATDIDVVGHVNNAAYWAAAEEELARRGRPRVRSAEIEFRTGLTTDEPVEQLVAEAEDGFATWLCVDGEVRASMFIRLRPPAVDHRFGGRDEPGPPPAPGCS